MSEQPMPKEGVDDDTPDVIAALQERTRQGVRKYGRPLQTHNGRDALWDAYEEALDLCQYLRQAILERGSAVHETPAFQAAEEERFARLPRKELIAEIRHLTREQYEYEDKLA